ncbi:MAG TPA: hypothetical protein VNW30_05255 [Opitutaceae bacterium]|jgi:predicted protein tyrosine phosphatase|nr:hypothetical protein [Opitutaceae bacterium]
MHLDLFERHLAIGSREEAVRMTRMDRRFWNVISICSPTTVPADLREAKRVHPLRFEDTEDSRDPEAVCVPRVESIAAAIQFAEETAPGGLLVHCQMGWSRSPAIALVLLVKKLWPAPDALDRACAALLAVRPRSRPNILIVRLGFELFMPQEQARTWSTRVFEHPPFVINRTETSRHAE